MPIELLAGRVIVGIWQGPRPLRKGVSSHSFKQHAYMEGDNADCPV